MPRPDPIARARALNGMLARACDGLGDRSGDGAAVIAHYEREGCVSGDPGEYERLARALVRLHLGDDGAAAVPYVHCHCGGAASAAPLWLRSAIIAGLKRMAGRPGGLLLVTGLREAVCPPGRRWTRKRAAEWARVREWVDALALEWSGPSKVLRVVVA